MAVRLLVVEEAKRWSLVVASQAAGVMFLDESWQYGLMDVLVDVVGDKKQLFSESQPSELALRRS